jgi:hypothetical protein
LTIERGEEVEQRESVRCGEKVCDWLVVCLCVCCCFDVLWGEG